MQLKTTCFSQLTHFLYLPVKLLTREFVAKVWSVCGTLETHSNLRCESTHRNSHVLYIHACVYTLHYPSKNTFPFMSPHDPQNILLIYYCMSILTVYSASTYTHTKCPPIYTSFPSHSPKHQVVYNFQLKSTHPLTFAVSLSLSLFSPIGCCPVNPLLPAAASAHKKLH